MENRSQKQTVKRSSLVDALRGISILLGMLFHFDMYYHLRTNDLARSLGLGHVITLIARNGYFGVTMFFVISGFLITSTSLHRYGACELSVRSISIGFVLRESHHVLPLC